MGGSFLAACSSDNKSATGTTSTEAGPASGTLRISNWPLYMADGFVADFQKASGITVDYKEDFNDNEQWFAKVKEPLSRKQDIGADLAVPTTFMAVRLHQLGWLNEISDAGVPNKKNLRPDLLEASVDPGRKYSAPYMSGLVGLAYNRAATGRDIKTIDDMWDPAFKGKVSMFSDTQDGLGMLMHVAGQLRREADHRDASRRRSTWSRSRRRRARSGDSPATTTPTTWRRAMSLSPKPIRVTWCSCRPTIPTCSFVVPESGGTTFVDTMVIPYTTQNQKAAEAWINYVYERPNYAKLVVHTQYVPVLSDMTDELNKIDPKVASNPLINPPKETLDKVKGWAALTDEQTQEFNTAYAAVTGG